MLRPGNLCAPITGAVALLPSSATPTSETSQLDAAQADLEHMLSKYPQGTLWTLYYGPRVEAIIAMAKGKPKEAIALLEPTRPFQNRDLSIPKLRGEAYLAAGQPALAEEEFLFVIAHHELDPELAYYPLSWLGLGRALVAQAKRPAALDAYNHFFALWGKADPDAIYLQQARQEATDVQSTFAAHSLP